jgi:hypothetical protein
MKRFVEGIDRKQSTLFPEYLEDWLDEDNPVRAVDVFVDELDGQVLAATHDLIGSDDVLCGGLPQRRAMRRFLAFSGAGHGSIFRVLDAIVPHRAASAVY